MTGHGRGLQGVCRVVGIKVNGHVGQEAGACRHTMCSRRVRWSMPVTFCTPVWQAQLIFNRPISTAINTDTTPGSDMPASHSAAGDARSSYLARQVLSSFSFLDPLLCIRISLLVFTHHTPGTRSNPTSHFPPQKKGKKREMAFPPPKLEACPADFISNHTSLSDFGLPEQGSQRTGAELPRRFAKPLLW